jgi:outer membrane protein TolC
MNRIVLMVLAIALTDSVAAKDLVGVYEDAVKNDPQIRAADANRLASRESRPQALAALLPQISGTAAYTRDHNGGNEDQIDVTPPSPPARRPATSLTRHRCLIRLAPGRNSGR